MGSLPSAFSLPSCGGDGGGETKAGLMDQQQMILMMVMMWSLPLPKEDGKGS
jgi:hypothetical protein